MIGSGITMLVQESRQPLSWLGSNQTLCKLKPGLELVEGNGMLSGESQKRYMRLGQVASVTLLSLPLPCRRVKVTIVALFEIFSLTSCKSA